MSHDEWSALAEEVESERAGNGVECGVGIMLRAVPAEHRATVLKLFADKNLQSSSIQRALAQRVPARAMASSYTIRRHRRGECRCRQQ
jgi:hypothetical protein